MGLDGQECIALARQYRFVRLLVGNKALGTMVVLDLAVRSVFIGLVPLLRPISAGLSILQASLLGILPA